MKRPCYHTPRKTWLGDFAHWLMVIGFCLLLLACLTGLLTSCLAYRETADTVTLVTIGTDAETLSAGKLSMSTVKQSDSVKHGTEAIENVTRMKGWFGLGNTALQETTSAVEKIAE